MIGQSLTRDRGTFLASLILAVFLLVSWGAGAVWVYYPSQRLGA